MELFYLPLVIILFCCPVMSEPRGGYHSSTLSFAKHPKHKEREVGANVVFRCQVNSKNDVEIYWTINERNADQFPNVHVTSTFPWSTIKVSNITANLAGRYCCCFDSGHRPLLESCAQLRVKQGPRIEGGPAKQSAIIASRVFMTCGVIAYPAPTIAWLHNGTIICRNKTNKYCLFVSKRQDYHEGTLHIENLSLKDSGSYQCNASNSLGTSYSKKAWLDVRPKVLPTLQLNSPLEKRITAITISYSENLTSSTQHTTDDIVKDGVTMSTKMEQVFSSNSSLLSFFLTSNRYHDDDDTSSNGPILLIFVLGFAVIFIAIALCFCLRRRKKLQKRMMEVAQRLKSTHHQPTAANYYVKLQKLKYPLERLEFLEELGEGVFGLVYKARAPGLAGLDENDTVAVKMLRSADRKNSAKVENFAREADLISTFRHPNLIELLGVCTEDNCKQHAPGTIACLLFEFMDGGDLCAFLRSRGPNRAMFKATSEGPNVPLTDNIKLSMCKQIACGMEYLSERNFIHRDLATRNCLISSRDLNIKIADFGLSRCTYESDYYTAGSTEAVPIRWMSPEAILYGKYSAQSDVWAYGVTLWEIYTYALQPYFSLSNEEVVTSVCQGQILSKPPNAPDWMFNLMKICWENSPDDRPNFMSIHSALQRISDNNGSLPNIDYQSSSPPASVKTGTELRDTSDVRLSLISPAFTDETTLSIINLPPPREFATGLPYQHATPVFRNEHLNLINFSSSVSYCPDVTTNLLPALDSQSGSDVCMRNSQISMPSCSSKSS